VESCDLPDGWMYIGRVKEEEQRLGELMGRLAAAQRDLEHNPTLDSLNGQIVDLHSQVETMERRSIILEQQASSLRTLLDTRSDALSQARQELNQLTKMNMSLSYQIDEQPRKKLRAFPNKSVDVGEDTTGLLEDEDSKAADGRISQLKDSIRRVEEEAGEVRSKGSGFAEEMRVEGFFQKCVRTAKQELLKSQELPRDSRGLQGSLYFELLGVREKPIAEKGTYRSSLQDRDYKNVVYYTVKHIFPLPAPPRSTSNSHPWPFPFPSCGTTPQCRSLVCSVCVLTSSKTCALKCFQSRTSG